jgi:hypothetical protein
MTQKKRERHEFTGHNESLKKYESFVQSTLQSSAKCAAKSFAVTNSFCALKSGQHLPHSASRSDGLRACE